MLFMLVKISSCRRYFGIEIWNFSYPHQKFIIIKFHWWQLEKIELSNFRGLRVLEWTKECSRHSIESASCSRCDGLLTIVEFLYDINAPLAISFLNMKNIDVLSLIGFNEFHDSTIFFCLLMASSSFIRLFTPRSTDIDGDHIWHCTSLRHCVSVNFECRG